MQFSLAWSPKTLDSEPTFPFGLTNLEEKNVKIKASCKKKKRKVGEKRETGIFHFSFNRSQGGILLLEKKIMSMKCINHRFPGFWLLHYYI